jgi:hypothetical protein
MMKDTIIIADQGQVTTAFADVAVTLVRLRRGAPAACHREASNGSVTIVPCALWGREGDI